MSSGILNLEYPVIGLAPMDGVSDNAFRFITKKYGNPDVIFTEFTNVMGLAIAGDNLLKAFEYDESQRPIIAQIYGKEPEYFYHVAKIVCTLGFDGVDINMGCPAKTVTAHGAGAGLIRTPKLAQEIIAAVKKGVEDWLGNGELTGLSERSMKAVISFREDLIKNVINKNLNIDGLVNLFSNDKSSLRKLIPVSVKTRIGYDQPVTESWIKNIDEMKPDWITVHGRTLKQLYTGQADWNEIAKAVGSTDLPVLANGDILDLNDSAKVIELTKAKGVLIGRGSFGNPWIFKKDNPEISNSEKIKVLIEHTEEFIKHNPDPKAFFQMRKHFGWYIKGFDGAKELRVKLMSVNNIDDLKKHLWSA